MLRRGMPQARRRPLHSRRRRRQQQHRDRDPAGSVVYYPCTYSTYWDSGPPVEDLTWGNVSVKINAVAARKDSGPCHAGVRRQRNRPCFQTIPPRTRYEAPDREPTKCAEEVGHGMMNSAHLGEKGLRPQFQGMSRREERPPCMRGS